MYISIFQEEDDDFTMVETSDEEVLSMIDELPDDDNYEENLYNLLSNGI